MNGKKIEKLAIIFYWVQLLYGILPNSVSIFIIYLFPDDIESVTFLVKLCSSASNTTEKNVMPFALFYFNFFYHNIISLHFRSKFCVFFCFYYFLLILSPRHINHDLYLYFPEFLCFFFSNLLLLLLMLHGNSFKHWRWTLCYFSG